MTIDKINYHPIEGWYHTIEEQYGIPPQDFRNGWYNPRYDSATLDIWLVLIPIECTDITMSLERADVSLKRVDSNIERVYTALEMADPLSPREG